MDRFFSIAGPTKTGTHYQIDPLTRLDWEEIQLLVQQQSYFVLHAPRQTGKTSTMLAMMEALNSSDDYVALYANIENAQANRADLESGIASICSSIAHHALVHLNSDVLSQWLAQKGQTIPAGDRITQMLSYWSRTTPKPCVLFLDEIDALVGDTLISVLRQIRTGYSMRPNAFAQSIVLCGVRDVRDYRIHSEGEIITGGSAFNIKSASLRMGNFSEAEVKALYQQHTDDTGQHFSNDIFDLLWQDTKGQPWLVNALAQQICWTTKDNRDRSKTITLEDYKSAREKLIYTRTTHLDQLSDKLKEPRVHGVIAPMLTTDDILVQTQSSLDDLQYVEDLGLITLKPNLQISNRIYQEVIPRELTYPTTVNITHQQAWYLTENNRIDMVKLLGAFQQFFRENIDVWSEGFNYKEAGPQLIMQAFLQRIVNGGRAGTQASARSLCSSEVEARMADRMNLHGRIKQQEQDEPAFSGSGRISREYALGRKRTDLLVEWPTADDGFYGEVQSIVIELKILHGALDGTIEKGLQQTADYADTVGAGEAHLIIFNRKEGLSWDDKIWHKQHKYQSRLIDVWGC